MPKRKSKRKSTEAGGGTASKRAAASEEAIFDSDEEPPAETVKDRLSSWRLDPEESLSDWTIEIVVNDATQATYHVHKQNLAVGPRRSEYFVKLFSQGGRFAETKDATSRIELEELASKFFPVLLDYLYDGTLPLTTDNATALHSMAKYFDMRRLRWEAKQFWQKDISNAITCGVYYEHARILNNEKVLDTATKACSEHILNITKTSRLVHVPEPQFWLKILQSHHTEGGTTEKFSCHVSTLIAEFAQQNLTLESNMFKQLTAPKLLPHIHVEAALPLIDAERQIVAPDESRLSNLQKRCIAALSKDWSSIDLCAKGAVLALAKKQSPMVLTEVLSGTLAAAKKEAEQLKNFHRLTSADEVYEGDVNQSTLPENHSTTLYGANVHVPGAYMSVPLFYYYKKT